MYTVLANSFDHAPQIIRVLSAARPTERLPQCTHGSSIIALRSLKLPPPTRINTPNLTLELYPKP